MLNATLRLWWPVALLLTTATCLPFDEPEDPVVTDGEVCREDSACSTDVCTTSALCSHSLCRCADGKCTAEGEPSDSCRPDWVCVERESILDPVKEFFGGKPKEDDGYCQPPCANGCPDHYTCDEEGRFCRADTQWVYPVPSLEWTGAVEGSVAGRSQTATVEVVGGSIITVTGSVTSPADTPIDIMTWTTVSQAGDYEMHEGSSVEVVVPEGAADYRRVELVVADAEYRSSMITVIFESCLGTGATCGFEGSGCCDGCDLATDTCQ